MDLDLALIRGFVAVAEHRHFGRAADELRLAQPALSRRIRRLERELGVRLLDRDSRGSALSPAGTAFLPHARALLEQARVAAAAAHAAAHPDRIVVGYGDALYVTSLVRALRAAFPTTAVSSLHLHWNDARAALLEHRVDAALTRSPIDPRGLRTRRLHDEARVVLVAPGHPLSGRSTVTIADLTDVPVARLRDADPAFAAFWRVDPRPDGRPALLGPEVATPEDRLELVASGEAVAIATAAVTAGAVRPDLVAVPVVDIAPVEVVLATRADDTRPVLGELHRLAEEQSSSRPDRGGVTR